MIGATLDEEENEEKRSDDGELSFIGSKEGCYEIIGTVKDDMTLKPDFVLEFINVRQLYLLLNEKLTQVLC